MQQADHAGLFRNTNDNPLLLLLQLVRIEELFEFEFELLQD